jgi:hypothetical protein
MKRDVFINIPYQFNLFELYCIPPKMATISYIPIGILPQKVMNDTGGILSVPFIGGKRLT